MELQTRFINYTREKTELKSSLIFGMCLVYIVQFFAYSHILNLFLAALSVIVFFISLSDAKPVPRLFSMSMFATGVILNFLKGNGIENTASGIVTNLPLLTLVLLVPLISIPLKMEGYFESVHFYMKKWITDARKLFGSISLFLFCLGPILNLGSIRVLHEMTKDLKLSAILVAKSNLVGFSTIILWSPYFASVALVLYYLHIPVSTYVPLGLTLAGIQLVIGNLLFWLWIRKRSYTNEINDIEFNYKEEPHHQKKIRNLFAFVIILMGSIFILEHLTRWPMMYLVSLISIIFPVIWCTLKRKWKESRDDIKDFKTQTVRTMNNEIVLFISAGLFGKALTGTVIADGIKLFLNQVASISFLFFIVTVMAIILVLTFAGVHQIVVVTALVTQMDPAVIGTKPEVLALLLMISWSASSVLSPINPLNLLVSGIVKQSALTVGLKWNGVYLLTMLVIGSLFVYLIH